MRPRVSRGHSVAPGPARDTCKCRPVSGGAWPRGAWTVACARGDRGWSIDPIRAENRQVQPGVLSRRARCGSVDGVRTWVAPSAGTTCVRAGGGARGGVTFAVNGTRNAR